ncbi:hypothetical protein ABZT17_18955 [Streptomyces sp. NPDC005648]|uniref:hypothetical protein n=1 Tax=Streptomyces sp. NPDC005648 TaxID=3157044 RepID=UPI0033B21C95
MRTRLRSGLSAALIALACLLAPCGALAAWAAYDLADTGSYVATMAPLAADPAVQGVVADTVGAQVMDEVEARADARPMRALPSVVRPYVHDAVRSFTRTEAFRAAWDAANRVFHDAVLHALRDDREHEVTVDLAPVTAQVKRQLTDQHMPLAGRIPVQHTAVNVLPAQELDRLRKGFHVLEVAGFWLPSASVVFALAGIAVAARRRRALTATGLGTALGGGLLALAVAIGRRLTLADLPEPARRPAAGAIYDALTETLREASWLLVALGLAVALTAWLSGYLTARQQQLKACELPLDSQLIDLGMTRASSADSSGVTRSTPGPSSIG